MALCIATGRTDVGIAVMDEEERVLVMICVWFCEGKLLGLDFEAGFGFEFESGRVEMDEELGGERVMMGMEAGRSLAAFDMAALGVRTGEDVEMAASHEALIEFVIALGPGLCSCGFRFEGGNDDPRVSLPNSHFTPLGDEVREFGFEFLLLGGPKTLAASACKSELAAAAAETRDGRMRLSCFSGGRKEKSISVGLVVGVLLVVVDEEVVGLVREGRFDVEADFMLGWRFRAPMSVDTGFAVGVD